MEGPPGPPSLGGGNSTAEHRFTKPTGAGTEHSKRLRTSSPQTWGAGGAALLTFFAANRLGVWWLGATQFASDAFYDGSAAIVTLALPSLLAGVVAGLVTKGRAHYLVVVFFLILGVAGAALPLWRVPLVSPESEHSGAMHYFLHSPLVILSFGTLGAWLAGQFAAGRWTLADKTPVAPPGD